MSELVSLVKGEKVDITKTNPGLKVAAIGLGWDTSGSSSTFDLDAFCLALTSGKLVDAPGHILYFGSPKVGGCPEILGGALHHTGDNLTGAGDGDDETMLVNFSKLPAGIDQIIICANIYQAASKGQNFGMVNNAFVRIYDNDTKAEIARFDLSEDASAKSGMVFGKLYLHQGEWKFQALAELKDGDINQIAGTYR